jgi:hypothetical protein
LPHPTLFVDALFVEALFVDALFVEALFVEAARRGGGEALGVAAFLGRGLAPMGLFLPA